MRRQTMLILAGALVVALLLAAWHWLKPSREPITDPLLVGAFAKIAEVDSYTQTVATETHIAGRTLKVEGIYHIDRRNLRFASSATTTLLIPGEKPQVFNMMNISIAEDVYVKISTEDKELRERIPYSPEWQHFARGSVPVAFADIAVSGPILDNLLLFERNGAFVRLVEGGGTPDEEMVRYTLQRADDAPMDTGGTLQTLLDRIGEGTVDVWIDRDGTSVRQMVVANEGYHSTTTFSNANHIPSISSPALAID